MTIFTTMSGRPRYSIIVPVYNRPQEVEELLRSLTLQSFKQFEVLLIEDGSTIPSQTVFEKYSSSLAIRYYFKPNTGPGPSRNFGFEKAEGDYFVVFDSDCIVPPHYLDAVDQHLQKNKPDAWGGPDRGHEDFTLLQRAMGFTMSSTVTTGGIRGGKQSARSFQPRSFNMGISRDVFQKTGGFQFDRFAEDIELSIRMRKMGFKVDLISEAYVYHKRRATLSQFFRQVSNFGKGRIMVGRKHPGEVKLTHWAPAIFFLGLIFSFVVLLFNLQLGALLFAGYALFMLALFVDAIGKTRSLVVSLLAIPSAIVQLTGYGYGFLKEKLKSYI